MYILRLKMMRVYLSRKREMEKISLQIFLYTVIDISLLIFLLSSLSQIDRETLVSQLGIAYLRFSNCLTMCNVYEANDRAIFFSFFFSTGVGERTERGLPTPVRVRPTEDKSMLFFFLLCHN